MEHKIFHKLPTAEIAQLMQADGPKVCVLILNGTRRWFMLEHGHANEDFATAYFEATSKRLIEIWQLLFDHGIHTLLMPSLNPQLMARSDSYLKMITSVFPRLTDHPRFLSFYERYAVRVRFYGDHRQCLAETPHAHISDKFDQLTEQTVGNGRYRLLFGVCAHDATETIIRQAIEHYQQYGHPPDKKMLTKLYYGEYIPPADLVISSGKLHISDMPLMTTGGEHLYFSVAPSLYLSQSQLRDILYDYLYARRKENVTYEAMEESKEWIALHNFYQKNAGNTLGIGAKLPHSELWYPLPQVIITEDYFRDMS